MALKWQISQMRKPYPDSRNRIVNMRITDEIDPNILISIRSNMNKNTHLIEDTFLKIWQLHMRLCKTSFDLNDMKMRNFQKFKINI